MSVEVNMSTNEYFLKLLRDLWGWAHLGLGQNAAIKAKQ